jgi:hypothetical protein
MAFGMDTSDLPTLWNYKQAQARFNDTKPIRGGDQSMRRLGKRSNQSKWLEHEVRDGIDVYIAGLYDTGLIEYYPTHYNISLGGWGTNATIAFMHKVAPAGLTTHSESSYIPRGFRNIGIPFNRLSYAGYSIHTREIYSFTYDNEPMQEHPERIKYAVDRKAMKEAMREYEPFLKYVKTIHALQGDTVNDIWEVRKQAEQASGSQALDPLKFAKSEETYWAGYLSLYYHASKTSWDAQLNRVSSATIGALNTMFRDQVKMEVGSSLLKRVN